MNLQKNIHELARRQEAEQIQQLGHMVEEKTKMLTELIKELSSPLIVHTLSKLPRYQANYLLLDLTGLNQDISEHTAALIEKLGSAANLLGTEVIFIRDFRGAGFDHDTNLNQSYQI